MRKKIAKKIIHTSLALNFIFKSASETVYASSNNKITGI